MSYRWTMPVLVAAIVIESWLPSPARADQQGEALLERLLQDQPAAQQQSATATTATVSTTAAAQTTTTAPREAIQLTPDRTEIVRLEQDAASVVVTNPAHAQVMMETPRLLLVMPRTPGSTSLFVLDKDGKTIFERDIIVSGTTKPYVRIRKSCNQGDNNCNTDSYFYCPDGCYEVSTVPPTEDIPVAAIPSAPASVDTTPIPGEVPPNAQDRVEPEPMPEMDDETGLDTETGLDVSLTPGEEQQEESAQ